jgi:hypothetical protein
MEIEVTEFDLAAYEKLKLMGMLEMISMHLPFFSNGKERSLQNFSYWLNTTNKTLQSNLGFRGQEESIKISNLLKDIGKL